MTMIDPQAALAAACREPVAPFELQPPKRLAGGVCIVGAGGPLGSAVVAHALARGGYDGVEVATCEPLQAAPRGLRGVMLDPTNLAGFSPRAGTVVVVFDRARSRESALFMPGAEHLPELSAALRRGGDVHTLALVWPHAPALLPAALRQGLWSVDEADLAQAGFQRLLFVRPAQAGSVAVGGGEGAGADIGGDSRGATTRRLGQLAAWMLGNLRWMVADAHRPVRATSVAAFVFEALRQWTQQDPSAEGAGAPHHATDLAGRTPRSLRTRVAGAETIWAASQPGALTGEVARWLAADGAASGNSPDASAEFAR